MSIVEEIRNGRIEGTFLGREDHGIFTAVVRIDYGGAHQGFGTFDLRPNDSAFRFIDGVIKAVGASDWEGLRGTPVRVKIRGGYIREIGHFIENRWFNSETDIYTTKGEQAA